MDFTATLTTIPAFQGCARNDVSMLAELMGVRDYPEGHQFTAQGTQGDALYLLIDGTVGITERDDIAGLEREVKELHNGELFGLLSLLDEMPAAATCTALTAVKVAALPRREFADLLRSVPMIGNQILYMVAVQLARDLYNRNKSLRALLKQNAAA